MARETVERNIQYDASTKLFLVTFFFGLDEAGKRIRKYKSYKTLREARAALREHEIHRDHQEIVAPKDTTLGEWLDYWLKEIVTPKTQPTTQYGYRQMIENHVKPLLGAVKIQELRPIAVQKYYTKLLTERNLAPNTVIKHHNLLTTALNAAVKQEVLYKSPMTGVEPPKGQHRESPVYDVEQLVRLFTLTEGTRLEVVIRLCAFLGLRREEACGLTWNDTDFVGNTIYIRNARTMAGSQVFEKGTKTESSVRKLHMVDELKETLLREKARQEENKKSLGDEYAKGDYVLVWDDGKPYRPNYVSELFTTFLKKNDLPKIELKALRHTFASLSNEAGVQEYNIGKAMGHSTPSTTKKIYTHLFDQKHTAAMEAVARALSKGK